MSAVSGDPEEPLDPALLNAPGTQRHRWPAVEMVISGIIGLIASFVLSVEAVELAANPDAVFSCDFSAKISCGTVGASWQASLFGFPNSFFGLAAEPVVITVAVAILSWGGRVLFPRWFLLLAQAIYSLGVIFAYWLFYEAYFVIGALCPWCLTITVTTLLVWMSLTRINILEGNFGAKMQHSLDAPLRVYKVDVIASVVITAILAAMVIVGYL
jgi:uncharacterized membrane protein